MKIDTTIDSAIVDFERGELYSGQKLFMQGEQFSGGFAMLKNRSKWLICDNETGAIIGAKPVSGYAEERLTPYLIEEARKQEFEIEVWDGEKSK